MTAERTTLAAGSIGITALNLGRGGAPPPLELAFDTLERARRVQAALIAVLKHRPTDVAAKVAADRTLRDLARVVAAIPADPDPARWRPAIFSVRFFSRQGGTWDQRTEGDPTRFVADPRGQIDLSGYAHAARADAAAGPGALMLNFDYGWYDEATDSWFHANHGEPGMTIYQSRLAHFSRPLAAFDRQVFCVAFAAIGGRPT